MYIFSWFYLGIGCLLPNFRWHRSRWGKYCPVELAAGNLVPGKMEFSVGYTLLVCELLPYNYIMHKHYFGKYIIPSVYT